MKRCCVWAASAWLMGGLAYGQAAGPPDQTFAFGSFGTVHTYAPAGQPDQVVLFISGDGGWNLGVIPMATRLREQGALVAGIDIRSYVRSLESARAACAYPAGELEELSRAVQLRHQVSEYHRPILVGYSSGATLVYAALASAPVETFAGAISLGFCPDLQLRKPLCRGRALRSTPRAKGIGVDLAPVADLGVPWYVLQGDIDQVCSPAATRSYVESVDGGHLVWLPKVGHGFAVTRRWEPQYLEAYRALAASRAAPPAPKDPAVSDLPLVEVPAAAEGPEDRLAVILTGDGGWAAIDKQIGVALAERGVPVVGWSSLSYYWKPRTPEGAAADLERILRHYLATWRKRRALLVGYSFGADVLPFLVNRLPEDLRSRLDGVFLLGLSEQAAFAFHVSSWLGGGGEARYPTVPEVKRLAGVRALCVMGNDETDSACQGLKGSPAQVVTLQGGHHFGGDYTRLTELILRTPQGPGS